MQIDIYELFKVLIYISVVVICVFTIILLYKLILIVKQINEIIANNKSSLNNTVVHTEKIANNLCEMTDNINSICMDINKASDSLSQFSINNLFNLDNLIKIVKYFIGINRAKKES